MKINQKILSIPPYISTSWKKHRLFACGERFVRDGPYCHIAQ